MKRNKDFYSDKFRKFKALREQGLSIAEAAKMAGVKYITAYMWEKRGRRKTKAEELVEFLKDKGPMPEGELKKAFPKLSEVFGKAVARGYAVERVETELKKGLKVWYLVKDDPRLMERIEKYRKLVDEIKERLRDD